MGGVSNRHLTLLERLDLALAAFTASQLDALDDPQQWRLPWLDPDPVHDGLWVARTLGLRGLKIDADQATDIISGGSGHFATPHHELQMVRGLGQVLAGLRQRAMAAKPLHGWGCSELFSQLTDGIARFRNNCVRRDEPWDAIPGIDYPSGDEIHVHLDTFRATERYGEGEDFATLHPVRQAPRLLWRLVRCSPFPDLNLVMGFVAFTSHLLYHGYPPLVPEDGDRGLLQQLVAAPVPNRVVQFESRLVNDCEMRARL